MSSMISPVYVSDSQLNITTPASIGIIKLGQTNLAGFNLTISIWINGVAGSSLVLFSYHAPVVSFVSPEPSAGVFLNIYGLYFGSFSTGIIIYLTSTTSSVVYSLTSTNWVTSTIVQGIVPTGFITNSSYSVSVIIGGQRSSELMPPIVYSISPQNFYMPEGNQLLTINGSNFLISPYSQYVSVGNQWCISYTVISSSVITCLTPSFTGSNLNVKVSQNGLVSVPNTFFSYIPPTIQSFSPPQYLWSQNNTTSITINGSAFFTGQIIVYFVDKLNFQTTYCANLVVLSMYSLNCVVPVGIISLRREYGIQIQSGNSLSSLIYPPAVSAISNAIFDPNGSDTLYVNGSNFQTSVWLFINYVPCLNTIWFSSSTIVCTTPPGTGGNLSVIAVQNGFSSVNVNGPRFFYNIPLISSAYFDLNNTFFLNVDHLGPQSTSPYFLYITINETSSNIVLSAQWYQPGVLIISPGYNFMENKTYSMIVQVSGQNSIPVQTAVVSNVNPVGPFDTAGGYWIAISGK